MHSVVIVDDDGPVEIRKLPTRVGRTEGIAPRLHARFDSSPGPHSFRHPAMSPPADLLDGDPDEVIAIHWRPGLQRQLPQPGDLGRIGDDTRVPDDHH